MTKVARKHASTQARATRRDVPAGSAGTLELQRDFRSLPVGMRQRLTSGSRFRAATAPVAQGDGPATALIPVTEQTIVLGAVHPIAPPPSLANQRATAAEPTDIRRSRTASIVSLLLPPVKHLYRGGQADLPVEESYGAIGPDGDWADPPMVRGRRRRNPDVEGTLDSVAGDLLLAQQRVTTGLRLNPLPAPSPDTAEATRRADELAAANDARMNAFAVKTDRWCSGFRKQLDSTAGAARADEIALAYALGGTSAALYTTDELAHAIAARALSEEVNA